MKLVRLLPHHIANLGFNFLTDFYNFDKDHEEYPFLNDIKRFYMDLLENPSCLIQVVRTLDTICEIDPDCRTRNRCKFDGELLYKDRYCLEEYGLKVGCYYSVSQLLEVFKDYHRITGFLTPVDKICKTF